MRRRRRLVRPGHVPPTFPRRPNLYRCRPRCAQVPAYLAKQSELKAKGISEVVVYCVNDMAVMEAWAKDQVRLGAHLPPAARPTFSPPAMGLSPRRFGLRCPLSPHRAAVALPRVPPVSWLLPRR